MAGQMAKQSYMEGRGGAEYQVQPLDQESKPSGAEVSQETWALRLILFRTT